MREYILFIRRMGLVSLTNLLVGLSGIILLPILTNSLNIDEYGVYVQITVTVSLLSGILALGLSNSMVRFFAVTKDKIKIQEGFYSIFFVVVLFSGVSAIVLFFLSVPLATALFNSDVFVAKVLPLIIFVECLNGIFLGYFRTFQQMKRYSVFFSLKTYLGVLFVSYFVLSGYGVSGAAIGLLASGFFILLITTILIVSEIGFIIPHFTNIKEYLHYSIPTIPVYLSSWIVDSVDRYLIGILLGVAFVGYYSPGYVLGNMVIMLVAPFALLLAPILSKYYDENNMTGVKTILRVSLKYFFALSIPAAFGLSFLSQPILNILTTPEIASQGFLITPFTAASTLFMGASTIISQIFIIEKNTKMIAKIWIMAAILNFGLNIILIPYFNIFGAAIATLIAYMFACIFTARSSFKYLKFDLEYKFILKSIIASFLMSLVILIWNPVGKIDILIVIVLCAVLYGLIIFLLKGIKEEEINFFKQSLKL